MVTVNYATTGGTAEAAVDDVAAAGLLSFGPGVQDQEILITVKGDFHFEGDETIHVDLTDPSGAPLGRSRGTIIITDRENDSDGDRIPDDFERSFGLDPENRDDAAIDSDGDGMTNLQEYLAGTDKRVPT